MQNIAKMHSNCPRSTSQQERYKERQQKTGTNYLQVHLNPEPQEQWQARLEADRETMAETITTTDIRDKTTSKKTKETAGNRRGTRWDLVITGNTNNVG